MVPTPGVDERALYAGTVVVLVALSAVVLAFGGVAVDRPASPAANESAFSVTEDGTRYRVHPSALRQGCPRMDCIPSIEDPEFQSADDADWLADDDRVIGVAFGGDVRAYPLRVLALHEVVNDRVDGRPVAVTYCPLCRSGLVFDRQVNGTTVSFGVSGKLLNANLVLYDRATETYWSQLNGSAIVGPLVPRRLTILPSTLTTWDEWRERHPDTNVLSRSAGLYLESTYRSDPYGGYADRERVGFGVENVDERLPSKTVVYGVELGNETRAYPESAVREAGVIHDTVGGVPVVLVADDAGGVSVFVREVDGETLSFALADGRLVDGTGTRWTLDGEATAGPREGAGLERVTSHGIYWFAWSEFNPETGVYRANGTS